MAQNKICTRDEIGDPSGTNVFLIDRHRFAEVSCFFVHCVVCNRLLECGPLSGQARGETLCFCLRRSEMSAQVGQQNSYTSYSQEYSEGVPMAPRLEVLEVL